MAGELSKRMKWADASITPTQEVLGPVMRSLYDLPVEASTEGAREVAQLAAWRAAQEFAFEPIIAALTKLRDRKWDPDQPFLLTDSVRFSWKTAPIRKYASFEDFYQREIEPTWGKWTDLQETWGQVVRGEITNQQGVRRVADYAARDQQDRDNQRPAHLHIDVDNKKRGINISRPTGTSVEAALRRLRKDRQDLHVRVLAGELTAHAAMVAAGFRRQRQRDPTPGLTKLHRAWKHASADDRETFLREVTAS